jgi:mRNA-degrading endonuclease RelE of RelBE toxin-antitoxin system
MVFVEASLFTKYLPGLLSDDDYRLFQKSVMERPDSGAVIKQSGGLRKVRWASGSQGKSGGVRVIYYWAKAKDQIYLLVIYSKSEKDNLSKEALKKIKKLVEEIEHG